MYLFELIDWLENQDHALTVPDGFGRPHCDRGSYCDLAFDPVSEATIGDMLDHARSAMGETYTGWKGGDYTMDKWTDVLIGIHGECGESITTTHFKYWLLTAEAPTT